MTTFFKKLLLFSCLLMFSAVSAKKTKKIQLLVDITNPEFFFALNDGNGITYSPAVSRIQGSYYIMNAFAFPGGTFSKHQTDFLVDKHGHPINFDSDNIGMAYFMETMLQTLDFNNLPPAGTLTQMSQWQLQFKHKCDHNPNGIFATGFGNIDTITFGEGQSAFTFHFGVTSGIGCNENVNNNNFIAKIYLGPGGFQALIKIKFDEEIEYKD